MRLPVGGVDGSVGYGVAAVDHHPVACINPHMAYCRSAVISPREKDNVPRLGFAWRNGRGVVENALRRCPADTPNAGLVGSMSILWTKKVERLCCFFKFLILLLLWCQITNRAMYPLTVIPAFYVFKDCSAGFL